MGKNFEVKKSIGHDFDDEIDGIAQWGVKRKQTARDECMIFLPYSMIM